MSKDAGGWKNNLELIVEKLAFFGQALRLDVGFSALNCRVVLLVLIWCTTASITKFCKKSGCTYCLFSQPVTSYVLLCFGNPLFRFPQVSMAVASYRAGVWYLSGLTNIYFVALRGCFSFSFSSSEVYGKS